MECRTEALLTCHDVMSWCYAAEYIQELNMHHGLYTAVVRSLQHYDRLQSHAQAAPSGNPQTFANEVRVLAICLQHHTMYKHVH